jgi:DNA invertase Pin-like site-specific DNA recombinase
MRDTQPPSIRAANCPGRNISEVRLRNSCLIRSVWAFMSTAWDTRIRGIGPSSFIGYTRVSTVSQTLDQQNAALEAAGVTKTFSDTMSGARDDHPGLAALMEYVWEGDTVVVWKLDRLGRNTLHILETVTALTDRGVTLVSPTDGIDSSTAALRMMIGALGSLAECERELVKERAPRSSEQCVERNGAKFGRPPKGR